MRPEAETTGISSRPLFRIAPDGPGITTFDANRGGGFRKFYRRTSKFNTKRPSLCLCALVFLLAGVDDELAAPVAVFDVDGQLEAGEVGEEPPDLVGGEEQIVGDPLLLHVLGDGDLLL